MKIYFDESGQTGCLMTNKEMLNFKNQPIFAVGSVLIKDEKDAKTLSQKYKKFKANFKFDGEIKGSDLMTKDNNEALEYFIKNILDDIHFSVNLYDKRFYLSTLLLNGLLGYEFLLLEPIMFYSLASELSYQEDDFFIEYCKYIQTPSEEAFHLYLIYLTKYNYKLIKDEYNGVKLTAQAMLDGNNEKDFYNDFMTFGRYDDENITNLINLSALGELINNIKIKYNLNNDDVVFIHDNIKEFEETFKSELSNVNITISFEDSKQNVLLQLADNAASITAITFKKVKETFANQKGWYEESKWIIKLFSRLISKINIQNIKFTVPMSDWAASICMQEMFNDDYPCIHRNNINFNYRYMVALSKIYEDVKEMSKMLSDRIDILKR